MKFLKMLETTEVEERRKLSLISPQLSWSPRSCEPRCHIWSPPLLSNRKWKENMTH